MTDTGGHKVSGNERIMANPRKIYPYQKSEEPVLAEPAGHRATVTTVPRPLFAGLSPERLEVIADKFLDKTFWPQP